MTTAYAFLVAHYPAIALAGVACGALFALVDVVRWMRKRGERKAVAIEHARTLAGMAVSSAIFAAVRAFFVAHVWTDAFAAHRLFDVSPLDPLSWIALFLGVDLVHYGVHRAMHRVRLLWAFHVIHHSYTRYASLHASRSHVVELLLWCVLYPTAFAWIGFPLPMIFTFLVYQAFAGGLNHADFLGRYPLVEGILNTPRAHRVHHTNDAALVDRNFGELTMIWDRVFGTYAAADVAGVGLLEPIDYLPVVTFVAQLAQIARDVRAARGWGAKVAAVVGPPAAATPQAG